MPASVGRFSDKVTVPVAAVVQVANVSGAMDGYIHARSVAAELFLGHSDVTVANEKGIPLTEGQTLAFQHKQLSELYVAGTSGDTFIVVAWKSH